MPRPASIAIHLMLAVLLLAPLHYYSCNSDPRDERFAWRMFSPVRVEKCATQFFIGEKRQQTKASKFFHNAWVGIAQRGRRQVIEAMAQRLCEDNSEVRVRVQCEKHPGATDDSPPDLYDPRRDESDERVELVSRGVFNFCSTRSL